MERYIILKQSKSTGISKPCKDKNGLIVFTSKALAYQYAEIQRILYDGLLNFYAIRK